MPLVAVLFPVIERFEGLDRHPSIHQIGHAIAHGGGLFDQGNHPARAIRQAPMIMGSLPETPAPAVQPGSPRFQELDVGPPDQ
jgi:hypothetical protein